MGILPKEKYAKAPKLYIQQNHLREVKANMQYQYRSSKHKKEVTEAIENEERRVVRQRRTRSEVDEIPHKVVPSIERNSSEDVEEQGRKAFSEMTIMEQLTHLTNKSQYAPRLNCLIKTEDKTHRGIVLSYENEEVKMRSGRREISLHENEIKYIKILSL